MPDLYIDHYFRGMVKYTCDERDASRLRGLDRVGRAYASRLGPLWGLGSVHQFGSRLPWITRDGYARHGSIELEGPERMSIRESLLVGINRMEENLASGNDSGGKARFCFATGRRLAMARLNDGLFLPKTPKKGDLWFTHSAPLNSRVRRLPVKRILLCHDLNQLFHYREMGLASPDRRRISNHCLDVRADEWVICISEYTKERLMELHPHLSRHRVFVVPNGVDPQPRDLAVAEFEIFRRYQLRDGGYFLSLAAGDLSKNTHWMIEEFLTWMQQAPDHRETKLVLVGAGCNDVLTRLSQAGRAAVEDGTVIFTGFLPDHELSSLYNGAIAFLYASLAEGFGLPPLEAMHHGTPVVCSNRTSLPEVVGDAGILFDPRETGTLVEVLHRVSGDAAIRTDLSRRGLERSAGFTWDRAARRMADVLETIASA